ncbi:hypothetical protein [Pseudomonas purpurea]|uniref:hypothetical protein n=1 Tax=Pseudomonas purpurea TaxID=3136737 RepID=UPI003263488F
MVSDNQPLILHQHVVKRANTDVHCREVSLQLSSDQRELILTRYSEHYSPDGMQSVERSHRVPVTDMLRWLIAHGEALPLAHSSEASTPPAMG